MEKTNSIINLKNKLQRKKVINYVCVFAILVTIFTGFFDFFESQFEANGVRLMICLIYGGIYILNQFKSGLAGVVVNITSSLIIGIYSCLVGDDYLVQLYLISVLVGTPFVINTRNKFGFIASLVFPLLVFLSIEAIDYNFFNIHLNTANPETISKFHILFNFILIQFYVYLTIRTFQKSEDRLLKNELQLKKQNLDLIKVNKELDRFVYSVSHDLRAPISSVLGLIELSKDETDLKTLNHYNQLKEDSLHKLDVYIHDVLDYSRNHRMTITKKPIDFKKLIESILENQKYTQNAQQVIIKKNIEQKQEFISDERRLKSVLSNVISNSFKYADLEKTKSELSINVLVENKKAKIEISDNGIGIEKEMLSKIFNMFYRANASTEGTGLGLYIAKETVERIKGSIKINSVYGEGTSCNITLVSLG